MLTRRNVIAGGLMAGAAGLFGDAGRLLATAAQPRTKVAFDVPAGACDCHIHIFGDPKRFPFIEGRVYTPELASVEELRALHAALHIDRRIVVQPSVYGTDNSCVLDALKQFGSSARGVVAIDEKTTDAALDEMARAGVRGLRLNLTVAGISDPAAALSRFEAAVARAKPRNWPVHLGTSPAVIGALSTQLLASPVTLVVDHFGGGLAADGVGQPGFSALVNLVKVGKAYVKLSAAADSASTRAPDYPDVAPLARALVAANPARVLWGTNWPHPDSHVVPGRKNTDLAPLLQPDDGRILNLLPEWVPDAAIRRMILVENPARLYGF